MKIQLWLFELLRKQSVTDGRTDNVKTVYPLQTKFAGGIMKYITCYIIKAPNIPSTFFVNTCVQTTEIIATMWLTPGSQQSKSPILSRNVDKKSLETVFNCHLSPHWRQMAIKNTVAKTYSSGLSFISWGNFQVSNVITRWRQTAIKNTVSIDFLSSFVACW